MRVVIDMQGAQSASRFRGVGRYAMSLCEALLAQRGAHQVLLSLNGAFEDTVEPIRQAFSPWLKAADIHVWQPAASGRAADKSNAARLADEALREAHLQSLRPDVVLVFNLFEGFVDEAAVSIGSLDATTPVCVLLHDLIPLLNPADYLDHDPRFADFYKDKVAQLRQAALLLANSESTRQEGIQHLGLPEHRVVNVSGAAASCFVVQTLPAEQQTALRNKFGIHRDFVLYTGGSDTRKNLPRLFQAYASLPAAVRRSHQLVLAGNFSEMECQRLRQTASRSGLTADEYVLTGYVTDEELVGLYNLTRLFVFPSWHEGLGLPALEAMRCGAAVVASNTSSLPEVVGNPQALFDPLSVPDMAAKIERVLCDDAFRQSLIEQGMRHADGFSWQASASRAWLALEQLLQTDAVDVPQGARPRMAFVSPLPPDRSGIADYSLELLPALAQHYELILVVPQPTADHYSVAVMGTALPLRSTDWLRQHADEVDRVLYQMGNSPFHDEMFDLLPDVPGVVVLHDFYLSAVRQWQQQHWPGSWAWVRALYASHGYLAVQALYAQGEAYARQHYPVNRDVLQHAHGVIVHSSHAQALAARWYGVEATHDMAVVPLLRVAGTVDGREAARQRLGLAPDDFVVCSFGFVDDSKLSHQVLAAWLASPLAAWPNCRLCFVGENHGGEYGRQMLEQIAGSGCQDRIHIAGWTQASVYRDYLAVADVAVQLRTGSRGESSAAVLDCMGHGLATIVNAHGSLAELPPNAVCMLPDCFGQDELVAALAALHDAGAQRQDLGRVAREWIAAEHDPVQCAQRYRAHIEACHGRRARADAAAVSQYLYRKDLLAELGKPGWLRLAQALDASISLPLNGPTVYLDMTATTGQDRKTGIERVARALCLAWLQLARPGVRIEPVYLAEGPDGWHYCHARRYMLELLDCGDAQLADEPIRFYAGDRLLLLDISGDRLCHAVQEGLLQRLAEVGVIRHGIVYDLLPLEMPQYFPPGADQGHLQWLQAIASLDGAVCDSQTVAHALQAWLQARPQGAGNFQVGWFHNGADMENSMPSRGIPEDAAPLRQAMATRPTFLMVGTVEPRKGHDQVLDAAEQLWHQGLDFNLVIVGGEGWRDLPDTLRRNLPGLVGRLRQHPEQASRLFWRAGISDEYLDLIYAEATCLVAASWGEGFGLPLIEAAQRGLPVVARDIPVFREVAGEGAWYFSAPDGQPEALAAALQAWLSMYREQRHPGPQEIRWQTWRDTALQIAQVCGWADLLDAGSLQAGREQAE